MNDSTENKKLSVKDIAERTGLSESAIKRHIRAGRLRASRVGLRKWWVSENDYKAYVDSFQKSK